MPPGRGPLNPGSEALELGAVLAPSRRPSALYVRGPCASVPGARLAPRPG
jgi:hypothetical protein